MKTLSKFLAVFAVAGCVAAIPAHATISITIATPSYLEDFDSMTSTGTAPPTGWHVGALSGNVTGGVLTPGVLGPNTGTTSTQSNFNYGVTGVNPNTDRAIGSLAAASVARATEARFTNDSGRDILSLDIRYDGEQWRSGGATQVANTLSLHFSLDGVNFVALGSQFNFVTPIIGAAAGALDGNAPANRVADIGGAYNVTIAPGQTFYLRWVDLDDGGPDAGIALDNFRLTASIIPEPSTLLLMGLGGLLLRRAARRARG